MLQGSASNTGKKGICDIGCVGEEGRPIKEDGKERGSNEAIHEEFAAHEFIGHVKERHVEQKACDAHGKPAI